MKDALLSTEAVHSSSLSGGLSVAAFMPKQSVLCPSGFRGIAARHFERGTNYD
jgi:hypothetical protein